MVHCRQYWEIAEENSELFDKVNAPPFAVTSGPSTELETRDLKERYHAVLEKLNDHVENCAVCPTLKNRTA
jgi:hypothetical protein